MFGRQCYIVEAICLAIKRLDFGKVRHWEICQTCGRYGDLGRLPKNQAPAAPSFSWSFLPRRQKLIIKSFSPWSGQLFNRWFRKLGRPETGEVLGHEQQPQGEIDQETSTLWEHQCCAQLLSHTTGGLEAFFFLGKYMVKVHIQRGLVALQSNLQKRAGLSTRGRRASKGGKKCPPVLVWSDLGSSTSDQEDESSLYYGKQINWNLTQIHAS